jgi:thermostable 8-oxoguanine DNA glycosylase
MTQEIIATFEGSTEKLILPDPDDYVMDGVRWGDNYALFTPSFWTTLAWLDKHDNDYESYRLGQTLEEEVAACLLGGYGIPAEVGWAAFYRIRDMGLLNDSCPSDETLYGALTEPLDVNGRNVRYRFARQKSKYLSSALAKFREGTPPTHDDLVLRNWLMELEGIGPKTASWITRNWLQSDRVAIIDIHIHRAGILMGLYDLKESPAKNYFAMESKFLNFAERIQVKASVLDALIWQQMKDAGSIALELVRKAQG